MKIIMITAEIISEYNNITDNDDNKNNKIKYNNNINDRNSNNNNKNSKCNNNSNNETGSRSPCMRPRSDPPNFDPIERGEKQTNNID